MRLRVALKVMRLPLAAVIRPQTLARAKRRTRRHNAYLGRQERRDLFFASGFMEPCTECGHSAHCHDQHEGEFWCTAPEGCRCGYQTGRSF